MTYGTATLRDFAPFVRDDLAPADFFQTASRVAAVAFFLSAGAFALHARFPSDPDRASAGAPAAGVAAETFGALPDPVIAAAPLLVPLKQSPPLRASADLLAAPSSMVAELESAPPAPAASVADAQDAAPVAPDADESVPVPAPRPPEFRLRESREPRSGPLRPAPSHQIAQGHAPALPAAAPEQPNFFQRLFGGQPSSSGTALAYAAPEDGIPSGARRLFAPPPVSGGGGTAVYDISAHTVYMPDGTRLEAHSGLGNRLDDPRSVAEKMRGVTPTAVYQLTPREQLFHGVQALRLTPVNGDVHGRTGLLAHTFMLGPNGQSNGCVSFRNYNAFLQAYMAGKVRRLVVVARRD